MTDGLELNVKEEKLVDFEELLKKFFPYASFRPFQRDAIKFSFDVIKNGKVGLLSSPCGTGKSISVLTAYLMAKEADPSINKLLALTRTKNQLEIYCRELKNIKTQRNVNVVASVFKSKKEMCPHSLEDRRIRDIGYRDFLYYCKSLKEGLFGTSCKYYDRTYSERKPSLKTSEVITKIKKIGPLLPEELYQVCRREGLCPYEVTKILTRYADVVIGNYNYVLVEAIRGSVLGKAGIKTKAVNCIFDEAHSLPYYAAEILSDELSATSVRRAIGEVEDFGLDDFGFLKALHKIMNSLRKRIYRNYGLNSEHIIEKNGLIKTLTRELDATDEKLLEIVSELSDIGETIRQRRTEMGRNPISYLSRVASFFLNWTKFEGASYARYVKVEVDRGKRISVRLGIRCLDPALAANVINELHSAILMSGTLWHTDYYIDVLGIERKRCETMELPTPFPSKNRLILVDKAVTTKFEERSEEQWRNMAEHLTKILEHINGRTAVYFPSYDIMQTIAKLTKFNEPKTAEERNTKILDVLQFLKRHEKCVILGVSRGKISEGVDMTEEGKSMLSAVVIVGLPYPKKTELQEALYAYFKKRFGEKAIEYANGIPCLNALAQSAGRLIRSPEDKGVILIMDGRASGPFKWRLPREWREEMESCLSIGQIVQKVADFYG